MHVNQQYVPHPSHSLNRRHILLVVLLVYYLVAGVYGFSERLSNNLRTETEDLFFHGYENYMKHAFPEDELRPLSCKPLTRDRENPAHIEVNDALGNYSLTLIDSLSTLAILASSPSETTNGKALSSFQDGVKALVQQYGDGSTGPDGRGIRARGFELDSKVQVFETVIRGLGGLLSAHLFAVGELPILGYNPSPSQATFAQLWNKTHCFDRCEGIRWQNGMVYNGQLLRLAHDLGKRLLPAFQTPTGLPYPRVNLKEGIPFYANAPHENDLVAGQCKFRQHQQQGEEVTETCSAGAGSLVLEFTVLSRLTGDSRFERLAKRAFWAVWNRRSNIDLIGAGINAETGVWVDTYTGIGAGIDSFFEYAFKSYVLLSNDYHPQEIQVDEILFFGESFEALSSYEESASSFLQTWDIAHTAIKRHLRRSANYQHPHYVQADLVTGAARAFWIDALSAYYPGLLTLAGHTEEAIESHLLATALWSRFSALPERWNLITGGIEGGLGWWIGRPEFIESNYYLSRATEDPWYKHVAEMTLRDIKRRCWTQCGWAGIQDVLSGVKVDRMESFFLGETAKYLFLTFDDGHPLNHMDNAFVFTTEGHPLIIPRSVDKAKRRPVQNTYVANIKTCPVKTPDIPFSISATAARGDVYHAASLARLHHMPKKDQVENILGDYAVDHPSILESDMISPSNFSHFPWTIPIHLIPNDARSAIMQTHPTFDISFPSIPNAGQPIPPLQRVKDGILVNFLGGLRLGMTQDVPLILDEQTSDGYRIHSINSITLGKDEKVFLPRDTGFGAFNPTDPNFTRIRDTGMLDLVVEAASTDQNMDRLNGTQSSPDNQHSNVLFTGQSTMKAAWNSLVSQIAGLVQDGPQLTMSYGHSENTEQNTVQTRTSDIPAIIPAGVGAAPIPDWTEPSFTTPLNGRLSWTSIYMAGELCNHKLPAKIVRHHQVIVLKRGNCSFSTKLANIPVFTPSAHSLQLVIVVSYGSKDDPFDNDQFLIRPLLDEVQMTVGGLVRQNPLPMVMAGGGDDTYNALRSARSIGIRRRYSIRSQDIPITNLIIT